MNLISWWLIQNTVVVAVLVGIVYAACRVLKYYPAICHTLWLIVLLKLLTPATVYWPWSVCDVWSGTSAVVGADASHRLSGGRGLAEVHDRQAQRRQDTVTVASNAPSNLPVPRVLATLVFAPVFQVVVLSTWALGVGVFAWIHLRRILRLKTLVGRAVDATREVEAAVCDVANGLGMKPVAVRLSNEIDSPFLWCLGNPIVIWPAAMATADILRRSCGVIAHELAHVRRRDHVVVWLELVAGAVWWWNPCFWFVRRQRREVAEMACDAEAIKMSADRCEYAETFLAMSTVLEAKLPTPVLAVRAGNSASFERRLTMILNERVSSGFTLLGLFFIVFLAVIAIPAVALTHPLEPQGPADETQENAAADTGAATGTEANRQLHNAHGMCEGTFLGNLHSPLSAMSCNKCHTQNVPIHNRLTMKASCMACHRQDFPGQSLPAEACAYHDDVARNRNGTREKMACTSCHQVTPPKTIEAVPWSHPVVMPTNDQARRELPNLEKRLKTIESQLNLLLKDRGLQQ